MKREYGSRDHYGQWFMFDQEEAGHEPMVMQLLWPEIGLKVAGPKYNASPRGNKVFLARPLFNAVECHEENMRRASLNDVFRMDGIFWRETPRFFCFDDGTGRPLLNERGNIDLHFVIRFTQSTSLLEYADTIECRWQPPYPNHWWEGWTPRELIEVEEYERLSSHMRNAKEFVNWLESGEPERMTWLERDHELRVGETVG